jgi:hypothetical protein
VMPPGEDHTQGTTPGAPTPRAAVANNNIAIGMITERLSHSAALRRWISMKTIKHPSRS